MAEPRKISHYEIKDEIGRGGMATVFRAYDPRFKRDVAIKLLPREFDHDPTFRARFEREAQTIAALEHSAIVPVYDSGEEDGQSYLVMRYMPGGSLLDRLNTAPLSLAEVAAIVERVSAALDSAHRQGVIHRDMKPGNILFDKHNDAYLSDFGLVKLTETTAQLSGSGVIGTPAYMAPEMAKNETPTPSIDIYGLGVTLFQMLTGKLPYDAPTAMGVLMAHMTEPTPDVREVRRDLPEAMQVVIARALEKNPRRRYQSAGELAADVRAAIAGSELATQVGPTPAQTDTQSGGRAASGALPRWAWIAAGIILLVGALGALGSGVLGQGAASPANEPTPTSLLAVQPTPTLPPTATPAEGLGEHVIAEWKGNITFPQKAFIGFGSVWVVSHRDPDSTLRIDPATNTVIATIKGTGWRGHQPLITADSVWVPAEREDTARIDPKTNTVVARISGKHASIAEGFSSIWATAMTDTLDRIDPATNTITLSIPFGDNYVDCNNNVMVTTANVWVIHCDEDELVKIDPAANRVLSTIPIQQLIDEAKAQTQIPAGKGDDFLWWVADGGLARLDLATGKGLTFLPLAADTFCGSGMAITDDSVWLAGDDGLITQVDVATNEIKLSYKVPIQSCPHLTAGFGSLWAVYEYDNTVQRLDIAP